jgi:hypothetical protein
MTDVWWRVRRPIKSALKIWVGFALFCALAAFVFSEPTLREWLTF